MVHASRPTRPAPAPGDRRSAAAAARLPRAATGTAPGPASARRPSTPRGSRGCWRAASAARGRCPPTIVRCCSLLACSDVGHPVERRGQLGDLVVTSHRHPPGQVAVAQLPGRRRQLDHRSQHPAAHERACRRSRSAPRSAAAISAGHRSMGAARGLAADPDGQGERARGIQLDDPGPERPLKARDVVRPSTRHPRPVVFGDWFGSGSHSRYSVSKLVTSSSVVPGTARAERAGRHRLLHSAVGRDVVPHPPQLDRRQPERAHASRSSRRRVRSCTGRSRRGR